MKRFRKQKSAAQKWALASPDNARTLRRTQAVGPKAPTAKAVARHIHPRSRRFLGARNG